MSRSENSSVQKHLSSLKQTILPVTLQTPPTTLAGWLFTKPAERVEDTLIHEILQSELVQQLLAGVKDTASEAAGDSCIDGDGDEVLQAADSAEVVEPSLYLKLAGGRAFVDQLTGDPEDDNLITQYQLGEVRQFFRFVIAFQSQRQQSNDIPCRVDPAFDEHFRFRIDKRLRRTGRTKQGGLYEIEVAAPWEALCFVDEPVHIILLKVTKRIVQVHPTNGPAWEELDRDLLSSYHLDWRRVLCSTHPMVHFPIQLQDKMKLPVGTLDLRLDLLNFKRSPSIARDVGAFLSKETMERNTINRAFYRHAKEWWEHYRDEMMAQEKNLKSIDNCQGQDGPLTPRIRSQRCRLVKLFGEDDTGKFRMVCKFITPLRIPGAIRSPNEAARFVSLLPFDSATSVGNSSDEVWLSMTAFLATGKGDSQDHATLLASLLRGCGLDAWVCIGLVTARHHNSCLQAHRRRKPERITTGEVGHVWVMTRGADSDNAEQLQFWEPLTGDRYPVMGRGSAPPRHGYVSLDCAFSDSQFFANLQPRRLRLHECSFDFNDDASWKALSSRLIGDLPLSQPNVVINPPDVASASCTEQRWSIALRRDIASRRRERGLLTRWSDELSFYLLPALNSYELDRLYKVPQIENELFQHTIKRFVPDGHTFQAVPLIFTSGILADALDGLGRSEAVRKMVALQGRAARFGLAVRCFPYPENLMVVWVMLAMTYQTTDD